MKQSAETTLRFIEKGHTTYAALEEATGWKRNAVRARVSELVRRGYVFKYEDGKGVKRLMPTQDIYKTEDGMEIIKDNKAAMEAYEKIISNEPFEKMKIGSVKLGRGSFEELEVYAGGGKNQEDVFILLSDFHIGASSYLLNKEMWPDIFYSLMQNILALLARVTSHCEIGTIYIILLGDMITGETLFPGQAFEIDMTIVEQLDVFVSNLKALLEAIFASTNRPIEVHTVNGNHGRVSRYSAKATNWDRIAYDMLARALEVHKPYINIEVGKAFWKMLKVKGHRYLMMHGDNVKMYQNIPLYGLIQASMRYKGSIGDHDVLCCGHFHTTGVMQWNDTCLVMNGTAYAGDDWALKELKMLPDTRFWMFGASDERPITWMYRIELNGKGK